MTNIPVATFDIRTISIAPVEITGRYRATGDTEATFYATTDFPDETIGPKWTVDELPGLDANIIVKTVSNIPGPDYKWSFIFQVSGDQYVSGTKNVVSATMYPPSNMPLLKTGPVYGYYTVTNGLVTLYFTAPPPTAAAPGWVVEGLPTLGTLQVITITDKQATLKLTDKSATLDAPAVYVKGYPAIIHETTKDNFTPGKFIQIAKSNVQLTANLFLGEAAPLRNLSEGTGFFPEPKNKFAESSNRGFSQGSVLSLFATGPQDEYLLTDDMDYSIWNPKYKQYSNFVLYQRNIPLDPPNPTYQGNTVLVELRPTELGDLLSNMYLTFTMPALPPGASYTPEGARAVIKQVDLLVNETTVETLYDDWYILRDQLFLDADETYASRIALGTALSSNLNAGSSVVFPLEFFFCRRHSANNKARERLKKPYFPLCAMTKQRLYVRFTFHPSSWWSNGPPSIDIINPVLITEEILLSKDEKVYYQITPLSYLINRVNKESGITFTSNNPIANLTANYPVSTMAWFFRNKRYESSSNLYAQYRYSYGYTSQYISNGITMIFPSSLPNQGQYVDVLKEAKVTLNGIDILSNFQGALYYSFKQPVEHRLSIPSKSIYTYSFGLNPTEYNQGGYLNFAKLNSKTTTISLSFQPSYQNQIINGYNMYIFYYGYSLLQFQGGYASLPYL